MTLLVLVGVLASMHAGAQETVNWIGGVGDYGDNSNWSDDYVPNGEVSIVIDNGGTAQATGVYGVHDVSIGGGSTLQVMASDKSAFDSDQCSPWNLGNTFVLPPPPAITQSTVPEGNSYPPFANLTHLLHSGLYCAGGLLRPEFRLHALHNHSGCG